MLGGTTGCSGRAKGLSRHAPRCVPPAPRARFVVPPGSARPARGAARLRTPRPRCRSAPPPKVPLGSARPVRGPARLRTPRPRCRPAPHAPARGAARPRGLPPPPEAEPEPHPRQARRPRGRPRCRSAPRAQGRLTAHAPPEVPPLLVAPPTWSLQDKEIAVAPGGNVENRQGFPRRCGQATLANGRVPRRAHRVACPHRRHCPQAFGRRSPRRRSRAQRAHRVAVHAVAMVPRLRPTIPTVPGVDVPTLRARSPRGRPRSPIPPSALGAPNRAAPIPPSALGAPPRAAPLGLSCPPSPYDGPAKPHRVRATLS